MTKLVLAVVILSVGLVPHWLCLSLLPALFQAFLRAEIGELMRDVSTHGGWTGDPLDGGCAFGLGCPQAFKPLSPLCHLLSPCIDVIYVDL